MYPPATRKFPAWGALIALACLPAASAQDRTASAANKAANGVVIGQVVVSSGATLNGAVVRSGTTLTSGSTLETAESGRALVKFSADTQVTLSKNTSVNFQNKSGRLVAEVISGTTIARVPSKEALVLETPRYTIEFAGAGPAILCVSALTDKNTQVSAHRGSVAITEKTSGTTFVLKQGQYAEGATGEASQAQQGASASPSTAASGARPARPSTGVQRHAPAPPCVVNGTPLLFAGSMEVGVGISLAIEQLAVEPSGATGGSSGASNGGGANPSVSVSTP